jgi:hypothetical protein
VVISAGQTRLHGTEGSVEVACEKLLVVTGSIFPLFIEAAFVIDVKPKRLSVTLATRVKVALLPFASAGVEAVINPLLPTGGALMLHPGAAARDTKVKKEGRKSDKTIFREAPGPLFVTVIA